MDDDTNVELLNPCGRVKRVEDFLQASVDVARGVERPAHHEGVGHLLLIDGGVPGLVQQRNVALLHLGQHQVALLLDGGVHHPDPPFIRRQVQICEFVAFFEIAEVAFGVVSSKNAEKKDAAQASC